MIAAADSRRLCVFSAALLGWSAREVIDVTLGIGAPMVEWGSGPGHAVGLAGGAREARRLCDAAGLEVAGLAVQDPEVTLADPDRAAGYLELAVALRAPHVRLLAPPYRGGSLAAEQAGARAGLDTLVELAAPAGVSVLVETSPGTLAPSPELAGELVVQQPAEHAGVLYDPGNMAIEGHLEPALTVARLGAHLRHVHVKNIAWHRRPDGWRWRHAPLASGVLDWAVIVPALAAAGYDGVFSIDHLAGKVSAPSLGSEYEFLRGIVSAAFSAAGRSPRDAQILTPGAAGSARDA
jgi:sugar phosphate isomerase/epimerase